MGCTQLDRWAKGCRGESRPFGRGGARPLVRRRSDLRRGCPAWSVFRAVSDGDTARCTTAGARATSRWALPDPLSRTTSCLERAECRCRRLPAPVLPPCVTPPAALSHGAHWHPCRPLRTRGVSRAAVLRRRHGRTELPVHPEALSAGRRHEHHAAVLEAQGGGGGGGVQPTPGHK